MRIQGRLLVLATAAAIGGLTVPAAAQSVRAGVEAWQAGHYDDAVRQWRPLAERGDADAQYNLAQAYKLGRGVPLDLNLAEQWYERAARQGHEQASANLGLILFQNGRRREAMPYIEHAAGGGDARAQYVLGTALFNGDLVARDWPRAYALMSRAAAQGLAPAVSQLRDMEQYLSEEDRARGTALARSMAAETPTALASATPPPVPAPRPATPTPRPSRVAGTNVPPSTAAPSPRPAPPPPAAPPPSRPAATHPAPPVPAPAASGRWRVQIGAFSSEANARRAWSQASGRLSGLQPFYVRAGALTRLQAGPLPSRAAAEQACARVRAGGGACFTVAP